jgi:hypothetical protein
MEAPPDIVVDSAAEWTATLGAAVGP